MSFRSKPETPTEPPVEALTEGPPAREEPPTAIPQIATPPIATPQISTQPPSTVTMTSESFMVQLMAAMMELLQRNAAAQPQPLAPVYRPKELLRTSAGEPQDDPELFIVEVESYFQQVGECNLTPRHRVLVAHRQDRGDAAKRNKYYRDEDTSVEELWVRLRRDYGTKPIHQAPDRIHGSNVPPKRTTGRVRKPTDQAVPTPVSRQPRIEDCQGTDPADAVLRPQHPRGRHIRLQT
jgi:hypothetical protein